MMKLASFQQSWIEYIYKILDVENNPCSFPYALAKVRGVLNAHEQAFHLIDEIRDIREVHGYPFETLVSKVPKYLKNRIFTIPPNYFKIGNSEKLDREEKPIIIKASNEILVGNYGVANLKDAKIVCDLQSKIVCDLQSKIVCDLQSKIVCDLQSKIVCDLQSKIVCDLQSKIVCGLQSKIVCGMRGIQSTSYRCAVHSSDGTLKRLARSKAICIAEVVKLLNF